MRDEKLNQDVRKLRDDMISKITKQFIHMVYYRRSVQGHQHSNDLSKEEWKKELQSFLFGESMGEQRLDIGRRGFSDRENSLIDEYAELLSSKQMSWGNMLSLQDILEKFNGDVLIKDESNPDKPVCVGRTRGGYKPELCKISRGDNSISWQEWPRRDEPYKHEQGVVYQTKGSSVVVFDDGKVCLSVGDLNNQYYFGVQSKVFVINRGTDSINHKPWRKYTGLDDKATLNDSKERYNGFEVDYIADTLNAFLENEKEKGTINSEISKLVSDFMTHIEGFRGMVRVVSEQYRDMEAEKAKAEITAEQNKTTEEIHKLSAAIESKEEKITELNKEMENLSKTSEKQRAAIQGNVTTIKDQASRIDELEDIIARLHEALHSPVILPKDKRDLIAEIEEISKQRLSKMMKSPDTDDSHDDR